MLKASLYIITIATILLSCSNNSKNLEKDDVVPQNTSATHADEHAQSEKTVVLNNGKKWEANPETTEGINKIAGLLNDFSAQATLDDYHSLKVQIENQFNQIIEKCTMTGEAHEQLHNYLIPLAEMFNKLDSKDVEICKSSFNDLKQHISEYNNFFD